MTGGASFGGEIIQLVFPASLQRCMFLRHFGAGFLGIEHDNLQILNNLIVQAVIEECNSYKVRQGENYLPRSYYLDISPEQYKLRLTSAK
jgi:hypothetical protein